MCWLAASTALVRPGRRSKVLREQFASAMLQTVIRENARLADDFNFRTTILKHAPSSTGAEDYRAVARELLVRYDGTTDLPPRWLQGHRPDVCTDAIFQRTAAIDVSRSDLATSHRGHRNHDSAPMLRHPRPRRESHASPSAAGRRDARRETPSRRRQSDRAATSGRGAARQISEPPRPPSVHG